MKPKSPESVKVPQQNAKAFAASRGYAAAVARRNLFGKLTIAVQDLEHPEAVEDLVSMLKIYAHSGHKTVKLELPHNVRISDGANVK